ncbi:hypothetical protein HCN44_004206 [Aphidius gifuensis]|uniref:Ribosomal protein L20 n=1 Tax=Aphidius gifuensis TaxID=684658 RepID=A0A834Y0J3_APHGI|nr:39S ribosomal protein L20, mitochondrial [Aphidius gifuensis]KAF7994734.1 hypothetical protein HCN44_004206 [Aphidius gifuensis]
MVFTSLTLLARNRGPDEFWRKRKIFKMAMHYRGRARNCYSVTIKAVNRAMMFATRGRQLKRMQLSDLWNQRLNAATAEHGITTNILKEGLARNDIFLNRKILTDLACWEPRTFRSLTQTALARTKHDGLNSVKNLDAPVGVITRGMIK